MPRQRWPLLCSGIRGSPLISPRGPGFQINSASCKTEQTKGRYRIIAHVFRSPWMKLYLKPIFHSPSDFSVTGTNKYPLMFKLISIRHSIICSRNNHSWHNYFYLIISIFMYLNVFWYSFLFSMSILVPVLNCLNFFTLSFVLGNSITQPHSLTGDFRLLSLHTNSPFPSGEVI